MWVVPTEQLGSRSWVPLGVAKALFVLSLQPGEFYRIKKQHKIQVGSFSVLQALEGTYICLNVSQCSVSPGPGKIFL